MKKYSGFTLVELIVSMMLMSILVGIVSMLISKPMQAYGNVVTEERLLQNAELILTRITRDVQNAVPNSLRVSSAGDVLEIVPVLAAARYRISGAGALDFAAAQSSFNILQSYTDLSNTLFQSGSWLLTNNPDPLALNLGMPAINAPENPLQAGLPFRIIIYNTGQYANQNYTQPLPGINIYNPTAYDGSLGSYPPLGTHVITPINAGVVFTDAGGGETTISLIDTGTEAPLSFQFALPSPKNILYIADGPVTYACNSTLSVITRNRDYPLSMALDSQPYSQDPYYDPSWAAITRILGQGVTDCSFQYEAQPGQSTGLLSVQFTMAETSVGTPSQDPGQPLANGVRIKIFRQIQVKNAS